MFDPLARQRIRPANIIQRYYRDAPEAQQILLGHSRKVCRRALKVARALVARGEIVDLRFIAEAAMLHDIGMIYTHSPDLGCSGSEPYLRHGVLGREMLEKEGLPRHALVCERHIGVGLSAAEIRAQHLPLPQRDMRPQSLEEQIICYADLFYSKNKKNRKREKTPTEARKKLAQYGDEKSAIFDRWLEQFEPDLD
jgi:uncharacterized protein